MPTTLLLAPHIFGSSAASVSILTKEWEIHKGNYVGKFSLRCLIIPYKLVICVHQ